MNSTSAFFGNKVTRGFKCILGSEASHMREMESEHYSLEIPCMIAGLKGLFSPELAALRSLAKLF